MLDKDFIPHIEWIKYLYENIENGFPVTVVAPGGDSSPITPNNELIVANKTTIIELKSIYGISQIRDNITGNVTNNYREYALNVNDTNQLSKLASSAKGRYVAGKSAEYGIGVRLESNTFTGDTDAKWGAIDEQNGMYFGQNSTGKYVAILDDGEETKIYQEDWNTDKLDGTGDSELTLDTTMGFVYNIVYTWYGYGVINFEVKMKTENFGIRNVICHKQVINNKTTIKNTNLPLIVLIEQTTSANNETIFVGGRQFSILGSYTPVYRSVSGYSLAKSVPILDTNPTPLIAFKQKAIVDYASAKISGIDVTTSTKIIVELYVADESALTGASWVPPQRVKPNETAFEIDISATSFDLTTANMLYRIKLDGGTTGNSTNNKELESLLLNIPDNKIVVLTAFAVSSTSTVDSLVRIREEW